MILSFSLTLKISNAETADLKLADRWTQLVPLKIANGQIWPLDADSRGVIALKSFPFQGENLAEHWPPA